MLTLTVAAENCRIGQGGADVGGWRVRRFPSRRNDRCHCHRPHQLRPPVGFPYGQQEGLQIFCVISERRII